MRIRSMLSIKQKLRLIIMVTVATALILACAAVLAYDFLAFRNSMRNDLGVLAEIFGSNSTAALSFGDQNATEEILAGLKAKSHILAACIYTSDGKPFAFYRRVVAQFGPRAILTREAKYDASPDPASSGYPNASPTAHA